jgi:chitinase
MAYYPDWVGSTFPPERIDFTRFDWIDFAFAVPDANFALAWDDPETGPDLLRRLVKSAHAHGTKVKLSLGGWSGSK